mgnify:FL=1
MSQDLISKQVKGLRCHAAVKWSKSKKCHWETGKARFARKLSQKNCLKKLEPKYAASDRRRVRVNYAVLLLLAEGRFFLPKIKRP